MITQEQAERIRLAVSRLLRAMLELSEAILAAVSEEPAGRED